MIDRFGPMPDEVNQLMALVGIKALCRRAHVEKVDAGPKGIIIGFRDNSFANPTAWCVLSRDRDRRPRCGRT